MFDHIHGDLLIKPLDTVGLSLGDSVTYQYLDLQVDRDADFGQRTAIPLPNPAARSFGVIVTEAIFTDNSIWHGDDQHWEALAEPTDIDFLGDKELTKQFRMEYGGDCKNLLLEQKNLWHCVCGAINRKDETNCHLCRRNLLALQSIDMDGLRRAKEDRRAAEKEQAEKEAAEARIKEDEARAQAKKFGKLAVVVVPALAIVIAAAVIIPGMMKKNNAYKNALEFMNAGQYEEAIMAFTALDGYKDSMERIRYAENAIAEAERAAAMETKYDEAIHLMESGVSAKENEAYNLLLELGDYKDARSLLKCFTYARIASGNTEYEYDSSGNLIRRGNDYHYEYENGHIIWEGESKADWAATTYTYYPDGSLKSKTRGSSCDSSGVTTNETVNYNEKGYPEMVIYTRDNEPDMHKIWKFSYTFSDEQLITGLLWSVQDYGETQVMTKSVDFTEYGGYLSDIGLSEIRNRIVLSIANANKTYIEKYHLSYSLFLDSFSMRKDAQINMTYDSTGKVITETTYYPGSGLKITEHYSYDDRGNLIEIRTDANENTGKQTYLKTYTYGYIYAPDKV